MWVLSALCLLFVSLLCLVGVFHRDFDDNLCQRIGMSLLCLGCLGLAQRVITTRCVPLDAMALHIGLAIFGLGMVWRYLYAAKCPLVLMFPRLPKE